MKKHLLLFFLYISSLLSAQTDYSNFWEDFYSYNNVKDFVKVDETIYALSDNAVFTYNITTQKITKLSSIQGLSGKTTSSIYYSKEFKRLVIGYKNGLIEVVDKDSTISISADIVNFNQAGEKSINHITEYQNKLYLSTPFAIVVYDIDKLEFGDTYFIANGSSSVKINQITIFNDTIYAATENGIFNADISNPNLIDFNNWQQNFTGTSFKQITTFNNQLFTASNTNLFKINGVNLTLIRNFGASIKALKSSETHLSIALNNKVFIFDANLNEVQHQSAITPFNYTLNNVFSVDNTLYLATQEFGVLTSNFTNISSFEEIHPEGPLSNDVFSIATQNNHLWVVYGGYDDTYTPSQNRQGFTHFNGETWVNKPYDPSNPIGDMVHITIDPNNDNKAYISVYGDTHDINTMLTGGLMVIEDNQITQFYNQNNSTLEDIEPNDLNRITIRIGGTTFDRNGNLWVANTGATKKLKKLNTSGQWSSFDLNSVLTNNTKLGLNEIAIDKSNSKWIGTRRNGVLIFNENGNQIKALTANTNLGGLPDLNVRTLAIDNNNTVWLGTLSGLVTYTNASSVFTDDNRDAKSIIILDDGIPKKLLGDQTINSIAIDGADNKWFGTDNGGVLYTNPNGQKTLANFSTKNSPLPSNKIIKISVDNSTGKIFFATDKGIVAYNSNVAPFGDVLGDVYAYPNPALKNHPTITIDGRNGTHLPKGTNVKILDAAGYLVFETNVVEGQQLQGGKVVWNKTNLAGKKAASGIYIVLLSNDDASETAITKIAIVN